MYYSAINSGYTINADKFQNESIQSLKALSPQQHMAVSE